jgi:hypothetical protein
MTPIRVEGGPFYRVALDIMGPLPQTEEGYKYILVIVDAFSKWVEAFPLRTQTAEEIASCFLENFITRFGAPREMLTDRGTNFLSSLIQELNHLFNIHKISTSSYNPKANGQCERMNKTLAEMLRCYVSSNQRDWATFLLFCLYAIRTSVSKSTHETPAFLVYMRDIELPLDLVLKEPPPTMIDVPTYKEVAIHNIKLAWKQAKQHIQTEQQRQTEYYNRSTYVPKIQIGDLVYVDTHPNKKGMCKKLAPKFTGPYRVIDKNATNLKLTALNKPSAEPRWFHLNRCKLWTTAHVPDFPSLVDTSSQLPTNDPTKKTTQSSSQQPAASNEQTSSTTPAPSTTSTTTGETQIPTTTAQPPLFFNLRSRTVPKTLAILLVTTILCNTLVTADTEASCGYAPISVTRDAILYSRMAQRYQRLKTLSPHLQYETKLQVIRAPVKQLISLACTPYYFAVQTNKSIYLFCFTSTSYKNIHKMYRIILSQLVLYTKKTELTKFQCALNRQTHNLYIRLLKSVINVTSTQSPQFENKIMNSPTQIPSSAVPMFQSEHRIITCSLHTLWMTVGRHVLLKN